MTPVLPPRPSLEHLKKQAKSLAKWVAEGDSTARRRVDAAFREFGAPPPKPDVTRAEALRVVAHEYGFTSWTALKSYVDGERADVFRTPMVADLDRRFRQLYPDGIATESVRDSLRREAAAILRAHAGGDTDGVLQIKDWTSRLIGKSREEIQAEPITEEDVLLGLAKEHGFTDWQAVEEHSEAEFDPDFEVAVDAVVTGQLYVLRPLLDARPELTRARSAYGHRATLLHYVAANGVETRRQMSPKNAPAIVRCLLESGAEVDALSATYGGGNNSTTLCLALTSAHPAEAGVQAAIVTELLDAGAAIEGLNQDGTPLRLALQFGYVETAEVLVARGASIRTIETAARLGRVDTVEAILPQAEAPARDEAFVEACAGGHLEVVTFLADFVSLDATNRNGETGLHWAAHAGHSETVGWLLRHGADHSIRDRRWQVDPAAWAMHGGHPDLAASIRGWPASAEKEEP